MDLTSIGLGAFRTVWRGHIAPAEFGYESHRPFRVSGFGGGLQAGVSQIAASGAVSGMKKVSDLTGDYLATQGEATVIAGAGMGKHEEQRQQRQDQPGFQHQGGRARLWRFRA